MCSFVCPCPTVDTAKWSEAQNWLKIPEKELNVLERTAIVDVVTPFSPLVFYSEDEARAKYSQTFSTFSACLDAIINDTWDPENPIAVANIKNFALETKEEVDAPVDGEAAAEEEPEE